jgi:hypothetical protein
MTDESERKRIRKLEYFKKRYAEDIEFRLRSNARTSAWCRANRERINARKRDRLRTDPEFRERIRLATWLRTWLKLGYDTSIIDVYDRKYAAQNGRCGICQRIPATRLCLDHCGLRKRLRALLCNACNSGLGLYRHNPILLRRAAAYVEAWAAVHKTAARRKRPPPPRRKPYPMRRPPVPRSKRRRQPPQR